MSLKSKPVKLYWWKYEASAHGNFGDEITKLIIEKNYNKIVEWTSPTNCEIFGVGSIADIAIGSNNKNMPRIWGTGFIKPGQSYFDYTKFDIALLRGKHSHQRVKNLPPNTTIPMGDPGLLASSLLSELKPVKEFEVGVIPHYVNLSDDFVNLFHYSNGAIVINPLQPCMEVIELISKCKVIISSSLHGLIVADSLGIPNSHLLLEGKIDGGLYKFQDYYSVFSEIRYRSVKPEDLFPLNIYEIADLVKANYTHPTDIEEIKNTIYNAF